ncbi:latrophilin 2 [Mytilus galloprovincialis]|uniref:Latrophilin 2 n=1 Tax=Mytilus galloprovincialis TaxID=29158 RepID=A0A8B6DHE7_MYTGA|nr:latrophilin 2 [Mytilus galloprovincialis]
MFYFGAKEISRYTLHSGPLQNIVSARSWANSGCYLKQTEYTVSTCTCNHLTNFAILMSPSDFEVIACYIVTAVLHYVFLVVFFLMLCEGISVARYVTVVFKRKSEVRFYLPFAWGVPLVIVGITLGVTRLKGYHSEKYCWLSTNNFVFMAFVGPALLKILINIGIIHVVLKVIYSTNAMMNERLKKKVRAGVKCMAVLIPVLGLSWLFGILAFNEDTFIFQYLFGISTSLQGFIIFIREAVSNKKLHEGIRRAVHRYRSNSMLKASSKAQSSGLQYRFDFEGNQMSADEYQYNTPMRANLKTRTFI